MTVSVVMIRVLVEACTLAGVSRESLLRAAEFDPARLDETDARVPIAEYERVQLAALGLTGDDALGLHMGEQAHFAGFDLMASLIAHAATLRDGIQTYLRFRRILSDVPDSTLTESAERATLRFEFLRGNPRCDRMRDELAMAGFMRLIQHFAGRDATVECVHFEHAAPAYAGEYRRIFGGVERFEQPFTGIEFRRVLLDRSPLHKDDELYSVLEAQAQRKLTRIEAARGNKARIVEYLMRRVPLAWPAMAEVAQHLGMSTRTLRRRLAEEGVTYGQAYDEALAGVAKNMLSDPTQTIQSAAYTLGFSDASAFHRAFKRWTGVTPKQFRAGR